MGASPLMSLGARALSANYAALQTTGHNIANANVEGYSRQQVDLATAPGQYTGSGFFGKGVDVRSVSRVHDEFLTRQADAGKTVAAMDAARLAQLDRLERIFPTGELGLGYAASTFLDSMGDLANRPYDSATRQVTLARADDLAQRFAGAGMALDDMQSGLGSDLRAAITKVNDLARSVAHANEQIALQQGGGQPPNDLLDERDRLIAELSTHLNVTRLQAADGTVSVFIAGGQSLVLGGRTNAIEALADPSDPKRVALGLQDGQAMRVLDDTTLGGGGIAGMLRFQNQDLVDARNLIGQLAASVLGRVNQQQAMGITLQSPLGSVTGSDLFAVGSARVVARSSNSSAAVPVTVTITDPAALQASDYDLKRDPAAPGNFLLTRLSDGQTVSIASGAIVDGMRIDVGLPAPSASDRFLLQPVGRAANGAALLLQDPRDLAAAISLLGAADPANTGTAAVQTLRLTGTPPPTPGATASVRFTDDNGNYSWELRNAGGSLLTTGTGTWTPGAAIPAAPADINGFELRLSGVPRNGDVMLVAPTPTSAIATNNGNALAMQALRDTGIVGGKTPSEAYAQALADIGVRVQGARSAVEISGAVAASAEQARSAGAGVNLDEEAARLIQFQQTYQAAAKVLQVAQATFDALLAIAAR